MSFEIFATSTNLYPKGGSVAYVFLTADTGLKPPQLAPLSKKLSSIPTGAKPHLASGSSITTSLSNGKVFITKSSSKFVSG